MIRWSWVAAGICAAASLGAGAEAVKTKERAYLVKYADGAGERYAVKWTLDVATELREAGGSYVPYQGNTEKRRCSWSVAANVSRSVSLVTRIGQPIPVPGLGRSLEDRGRLPAVAGQRDEPCKSAEGQRDQDVAAARSAALEAFERMTNADFEELVAQARSAADVAAVVVQ